MTAAPHDLSPLEAMELRRDDLFQLLCREGGSVGDWAELNRMTATIQAELLGDFLLPPVAIDHAGIDAWLDSHSHADPLVCDDVPYD
jgi:hypothetical protein